MNLPAFSVNSNELVIPKNHSFNGMFGDRKFFVYTVENTSMVWIYDLHLTEDEVPRLRITANRNEYTRTLTTRHAKEFVEIWKNGEQSDRELVCTWLSPLIGQECVPLVQVKGFGLFEFMTTGYEIKYDPA